MIDNTIVICFYIKTIKEEALRIIFKTVDWFVTIILFTLFQYFAIRWLFSPELFYDEGYYIMGARRILEGDWFLQNHSFDKPFLHPVLVAISGVIFGQHYLGFRILGWFCLSLSYFLFSCSLDRLFKDYFEKWTVYILILKWSLIVGLFFNPMLISNSASSMGEAYLLLFLLVILLNYPIKESYKNVKGFVNGYGFAFWIKGSILIWLPLLIVFPFKEILHEIKNKWRFILLPTMVVSLLGLWYGVVGKTKLFVFRYLLDVLFSTEGSYKEKVSSWNQFLSWLKIVNLELGFGFYLLILLLIIASFYLFKKADYKKHFLAFWLTFLLFGIIVVFTKVGLMPRYLITITPLVFFFLAVVFVFILQIVTSAAKDSFTLPKKSRFLVKGYSILISLISMSLPFSLKGWLPTELTANAKLSPAILSEIPAGATLIDKLIWPAGAYVTKDVQVVEVPYDQRLNRHSNFSMKPDLFAYDEDKLYEGIQFVQNQLYCPEMEDLNSPILTISEEAFKDYFLKALMAKGKLEWISLDFKEKEFERVSDFLRTFPFSFKEAHAGLSVTGKLKSRDQVSGELPMVSFKGVFILYHGRSVQQQWASDNWVLGIRIEQIHWENKSMDLLPFVLIAKQGLTIPIVPLLVEDESVRPLKMSVNLAMGKSRKINIFGVKMLKKCSKSEYQWLSQI